ncbi:MAG: hypothetical protein ACRDRD_09625 [Pseudonocardiaceae bacterium]
MDSSSIFPDGLTTGWCQTTLGASIQYTEEALSMRLTRQWRDCPDTESCPTLYSTDRGTAVVQGYLVTDPEALGVHTMAPGVTAVEVPFALCAGLAISGPTLCSTEHGTVVVRGTAVTDPEALATLRLPIGEAAVEIHLCQPANPITQEVPA